MKNHIKSLALGVFALVLFTLGQGAVRADQVSIAGYTNGCFGPCTPPNSNPALFGQQTSSLLGLTYSNSTFSGTTSNGFLGLGDTGQRPGTDNVDNLGSFTLNGDPNLYNGQTFTLRVTFTVPAGIAGSNTTTYDATLIGSVSADRNGGVFIHFTTPPQTFTFANNQNIGSFTLTVTDVNVIAGGVVPLTGNIIGSQQTVVPEPATLLLLGTGLSGVAARIRQRRKAAKTGQSV